MRRAFAAKFACVLLICFGVTPAVSAKEKRVALVIGNSDYEHVSRLTNPSNDAEDLGDALVRLGFDVTSGKDLDYREMRLVLRDFSEKAANADVALVYFAGHGIEIDKNNYLIPVNAELKRDRDVEFEAIRLDTVIASLSDAKGVRMVLLDACRNNPFLVDMQRTTASRSIGRGLGRIDPGGVLVSYAARGGTIALDGEGRNSPYAEAILANIEVPGLEIGKLFRRVRDMVLARTGGFQEPFTYGSLPGDDIFLVPPIGAAAVAPPVPKAVPSVLEEMLEEFADAEKLGTLRSWESFISRFGDLQDNRLVQIALRRQAELQRERDQLAESARPQPVKVREFDENGHAILEREQRRKLQEALAYMGHYSGAIDGDIGAQSRSAIASARMDAQLPPGTHVDQALLAALPDVAATKGLIRGRAQYFDLDELPAGLDPRLDKALRYFNSPPNNREVLFDYFRGTLYLVVLGPSDGFSQANRLAVAAGGHLVTIQNATENQFLIDLFAQDRRFIIRHEGGWLIGPLIGLYQEPGSGEPNGGWSWVTGEPLTYTAWGPNNPDDEGGLQHWGRFFLDRNRARPDSVPRHWDDIVAFGNHSGFIVEID